MVKAVEFGVIERGKGQGGFYLIITRDKWILSHSCLLVIRVVSLRDNAHNTVFKVTAGREWNVLDRLKSRLGIKRDIKLIVSTEINEQGVWRTRQPVLVLPEKIADCLSDGREVRVC